MSRFIIFFIVLTFPAIALASRGIDLVSITDSSGDQVLFYHGSHALLVGVSEYTNGWPNLPGVREDINEVEIALKQKGFHTVVVINPTRTELRNSIENFIINYGQDEDNRLIFYFAGHGHTMKLSYGEEMGYFVPADAPNPNRDKPGFLAKSINMESVEVYSKQIQSKHALFLFDSCFSGSLFALSRAIPENISFKTSKPVRQFITAGSADETVPDESIFNDQFIRALNGEGDLDGDGYLTGVELGEFLQKTVINYSKGSQHPQYGKIRNPNLDKGDFVFSLLTIDGINNSIDEIIQKREKLGENRLEIKQKQVEALKRLENERIKLKEEQKKLKIEKEKLARLTTVPKNRNFKITGKVVQVVTKSTPLRVRKEPSSKSLVVANIPSNAIVPLIGEVRDWFQVYYQRGKMGWIPKRYSRVVKDNSKLKTHEKDREIERDLLKELEGLARLKSSPPLIHNVVTKKQGSVEETPKTSESYDSIIEKLGTMKIAPEPIKVEVFPARLDSSSFQDKLSSLSEVTQKKYVGKIQDKVFKNWQQAEMVIPSEEKVIVSFSIFPLGSIDKPHIEKSSGVDVLDALAIEAIEASMPFPEFPEGLNRANLHVEINFKYVPPSGAE
jgi:TonB family protein